MKDKPITATIEELKKQYGKNHFDWSTEDCERVSSGLISIDKIFGGNGLPKRKIIELFGNESSGKTGLALQFAKAVTSAGEHVCYIDAEHGLNVSYLNAFGLSIDDPLFVFSRPHSGEEAGEIAEAMLGHKDIGLIVIDSVPSLVPRAEIEGDIGDAHMGLAARLMGQIIRKMVPKLSDSNASVIFINQVRETMNPFGPSEVTPGGRALRFYSSVRIKTTKVETILENAIPVGIKVKIKNIKNKTSTPYLETVAILDFASGFSVESDLLDNASSVGVIDIRGAWIYYIKGEEEIKLGQGRPKTIQLLKDNKDLYKEIYDKTLALVVK